MNPKRTTNPPLAETKSQNPLIPPSTAKTNSSTKPSPNSISTTSNPTSTPPSFTTPMMQQFVEIKKQYQDCFLFFRMGDFYELFLEDAKKGAQILDITLTSRAKGRDGKVPMAGVPYHAAEQYIHRLVKSGHKVAICEQMTPPDSKGIVEREVIRVVTPGTLTDDTALDTNRNNYITAIISHKKRIGIAAADLSTGAFTVSEVPFTSNATRSRAILDELGRINPAECILPPEHYDDPEFIQTISQQPGLTVFSYPDWDIHAGSPAKTIKKHFAVSSLSVFNLNDSSAMTKAAAALLGYLTATQKRIIHHITKISIHSPDNGMVLDRSTIANLELFSTIRGGDADGSLIRVLDQTQTGMGARMLRTWISQPLTDPAAIRARHEAVACFQVQRSVRMQLRGLLKQTTDIERTLARLSLGSGTARDLVSLQQALTNAAAIKELLTPYADMVYLKELDSLEFDPDADISEESNPHIIPSSISRVTDFIRHRILPEPGYDVKNGNLINPGVSRELDILRKRVQSGRDWIVDLEAKERERTGISSLKVRYNKVFGFYIEVSKSNLDAIPENYQRKQTLVNGERFITPELKDQEELILDAQDRMNTLEYELFSETVTEVLKHTELLQQTARTIARIDVLSTFAHIAEQYHYVRPVITPPGDKIELVQCRHPVVERLIGERRFVPNTVTIGGSNPQVILITGPNMAGKSVLIRQIALVSLMAQIGCFVPADSARISVVDRIFVRSGASDVIAAGLSTFMVEMVETAQILLNATRHSLIIMDEIGRGTSTYDGISIAWAVVEYLLSNEDRQAKTLFATHYHELQELENEYPEQLVNMHMAVDNEDGEPVFLHSLTKGGASHSFGLAVARMAGVPDWVNERAGVMLAQLERQHGGTSKQQYPPDIEPPESGIADSPTSASSHHTPVESTQKHLGPLESTKPATPQPDSPTSAHPKPAPKQPHPSLLKQMLDTINPDALTPREALDVLYRLKDHVESNAELELKDS